MAADVVFKDVDMAERFEEWNELVRIARAADEIGMFGGGSGESKLRAYRSVARAGGRHRGSGVAGHGATMGARPSFDYACGRFCAAVYFARTTAGMGEPALACRSVGHADQVQMIADARADRGRALIAGGEISHVHDAQL